MKQTILTIGTIFLLTNIAFGFMLNSFDTFNVIFSSGAIVATLIFFLLIDCIKLKDAFKISLYFNSAICGLIEYIIGLVVEHDMPNNWYYVALIVLLAFQLVLLTVANITSKKFV